MKNLLQFIQGVLGRKPKQYEKDLPAHNSGKMHFRRGSKCSTKGAFGRCHQIVSNITEVKAQKKLAKLIERAA